jgi:hypothetical protein
LTTDHDEVDNQEEVVLLNRFKDVEPVVEAAIAASLLACRPYQEKAKVYVLDFVEDL